MDCDENVLTAVSTRYVRRDRRLYRYPIVMGTLRCADDVRECCSASPAWLSAQNTHR